MSANGYRVLSLDGGGIRGFSLLLILDHLFYRINQLRRQHDLLPVEPYQYFDLIGGVSGGGTIALMLGRLRMSIRDTIEQYEEMGCNVFRDLKRTGRYMFDKDDLKRSVQSVVHQFDPTGNRNARLADPLHDDCCKTVVYALPFHNPNQTKPTPLRSYHSLQERITTQTIWEVACATSAVPKVFESLRREREHEQWIDAAMKFKNPAELLIDEVLHITRNDPEWAGAYPDERLGLLLSIGTGKMASANLSHKGLIDSLLHRVGVDKPALEAVVRIATDSEATHGRLFDRFQYSAPNVYRRFNVVQGLEHILLYEREKLDEIKTATRAYLDDPEVDREVWRTVRYMCSLMPENPLPHSLNGRRSRPVALHRHTMAFPGAQHVPRMGFSAERPSILAGAVNDHGRADSRDIEHWGPLHHPSMANASKAFFIAPHDGEYVGSSRQRSRFGGSFVVAPQSPGPLVTGVIGGDPSKPCYFVSSTRHVFTDRHHPARRGSEGRASIFTPSASNFKLDSPPHRAADAVASDRRMSGSDVDTTGLVEEIESTPLPEKVRPLPTSREVLGLLNLDNVSYWEHLTPSALIAYSDIYDHLVSRSGWGRDAKLLSKTKIDQYFQLTRQAPHTASHWLRLDRDHHHPKLAWPRPRCTPKAGYSKNLTLAYMFMLHVEVVNTSFWHTPSDLESRGCHDVFSDATLDVLAAFGNWVDCSCTVANGGPCGRVWSFANDGKGMMRPANNDGTAPCCLLADYIASQAQGRPSPTLTPEETAEAQRLRNACYEKWLHMHEAEFQPAPTADRPLRDAAPAPVGRPRRHTTAAAEGRAARSPPALFGPYADAHCAREEAKRAEKETKRASQATVESLDEEEEEDAEPPSEPESERPLPQPRPAMRDLPFPTSLELVKMPDMPDMPDPRDVPIEIDDRDDNDEDDEGYVIMAHEPPTPRSPPPPPASQEASRPARPHVEAQRRASRRARFRSFTDELSEGLRRTLPFGRSDA